MNQRVRTLGRLLVTASAEHLGQQNLHSFIKRVKKKHKLSVE